MYILRESHQFQIENSLCVINKLDFRMKNIKKQSIDTKRQKHRYKMFITEQRGFAKIDNNPCNHYKLLYTYYIKALRWKTIF
jgi:hypothetical protein